MLRRSIAALAALLLGALVLAPDALAQAGRTGAGRGEPGQRQQSQPRRARPAAGSLMPAAPSGSTATNNAESGPQPTGVVLDRVVAIVNDGIVTASEFEEEINSQIRRLRQENRQGLPPEAELRRQLRAPVLDYLVMREVQLQRADRIGLKVSDEELLRTMTDMAARNGLTLAQLPEVMKAQGLDFATERENTRREILLYKLRQREVVQQISITSRELDQYMERLRKLPFGDDEFNISHILIATAEDANKAQVEAAEKKAQEVYELTASQDFAQLALQYSQAQTALQGGSLGWIKGTDLPTWSAEVVARLKPGEISKPFNAAPLGWMIVKLNDVRRSTGDPVKDQVHVRHILLKTNELQDDATVKLKLAGIRQRILDGEDFAVFASTMSADTRSAIEGGDIDWITPDQFDAKFAEVVAGLKENEISQPFKSEYGWHIVQLLGRRKFDTTEDELRERAYQQLSNAKANQEGELWLRQLRDEAYIETNP